MLDFYDAYNDFKNINAGLFDQNELELLSGLMGDIHYDPSIKYLSEITSKEKKHIDDKLTLFMKKYWDKYPAGSCGNLHNFHLEEIGAIFPRAKFLYLTVGSLIVDGRNIYNVPPPDQVSSIYLPTNNQFHIWITLDSGEIIDLAHNTTLSLVRKDKSLLKPIYGAQETIFKKYGMEYNPYNISGHIDNTIDHF
jgi:hypothetical protein